MPRPFSTRSALPAFTLSGTFTSRHSAPRAGRPKAMGTEATMANAKSCARLNMANPPYLRRLRANCARYNGNSSVIGTAPAWLLLVLQFDHYLVDFAHERERNLVSSDGRALSVAQRQWPHRQPPSSPRLPTRVVF